MVLFLCFIWLLLIYVDSYIMSEDKDVFSPLRLVTLRFIFQHLPFILFIAFFPQEFIQRILYVCDVGIGFAFVKYTLLQTIAYYCMYFGISVVGRKKVVNDKGNVTPKLNPNALFYLGIVLYIIGISSYCVFLYRIGGLSYLFDHISERVLLQRGQYILGLLNLFYIVPLLFMLRIRYFKQKRDKILLVISVLTYLFIANSLGAREPTIVFAAVVIIGYHYIFKKFLITKRTFLWGLVVLPFILAYMLVVPLLRNDFNNNTNAQSLISFEGVKKIVYQTSYVFIDVFSANYFNEHNAWWLGGYFAPVAAINAKGDKRDIPEVDQGVYFRSIVTDNKYYKPPVPRGKLSKTSWPTENFGFAYANFLLPGIIFFYFLQGVVFGVVYRLMKNNLNNAVAITLYVFTILYFNFSSLRLAFFVKTLPLILVVYFIYLVFILGKNPLAKR